MTRFPRISIGSACVAIPVGTLVLGGWLLEIDFLDSHSVEIDLFMTDIVMQGMNVIDLSAMRTNLLKARRVSIL